MQLTKDPVSLGDRLLAACLSAFFVGLIALALPALVRRRSFHHIMETYSSFSGWGLAVVLAAALAGFLLGSNRAAVLFGHFLGIEQPRNKKLTLFLWAAFIAIACMGDRLLAS